MENKTITLLDEDTINKMISFYSDNVVENNNEYGKVHFANTKN